MSRSRTADSRSLPIRHAVDVEALADDLADAHARVEAGVRVLEDDLDVAPGRLQLARVEVEERLALEADLAVGRRDQPQDDLAERRLAAAGLAHEAERLTFGDVEADPVDGANRAELADAEQAAADVEVLDEVLDLEQRRLGGPTPRCDALGARRAAAHLVAFDGGDRLLLHPHRAATVSASAACSASSPAASAPTSGCSPAGVSQHRLRCVGLPRGRGAAYRRPACGTDSVA